MDGPIEAPPATRSERVVLGLLGVGAFAWIAVLVGLALSLVGKEPVDAGTLVRGISIASGPLVLIVAVLILWQRNTSRSAQRYADVARLVRMETLALDAVLGLASRRLAEDRAAVAEQADRMVMLADETSARMHVVTDNLARGIEELSKQTEGLDVAAGAARVDLGVLLSDLPRAEEKTRALADAIRATGLGAHEQAAALEAVLATISSRAKDAEEHTGGVANRLSAQATQIATVSELAARNIDDARQRMTDSIDGVLERTGEAMEQARQGIGAQGEAIDLMVDRARLAAETASTGAAQAVQAQIALLSQEVERLAGRLGAQDAVGAALIERVQRGLSHVEARFVELDETGRTRTERLVEALGGLAGHAERTLGSLNAGGTAATTLINRAETLKAAIGACLGDLSATLPAAFSQLEADAARSLAAIGGAAPEVERLSGAAREAADALDGARAALDDRRAAIDALADTIQARIAGAQSSAEALSETVSNVDEQASRLAESTSPKLVESLIRVRETAGHAAERAREALGTIIPSTADALGKAGRTALERAIGNEVEGQIGRLTAASDLAVEATRAAGERLEEQLARIAATSAQVGGEIAAGRAAVEDADRENLARRVAVLIDSLNATTVDVSKLMSTETSDEAWQAYLKGDRGTFTRRTLKLVENGDAREIVRLYEQQPVFRDRVNRYVADFEQLLRPILSTRDGSTLAVILLSSDMGKLYVALAQSIERLRA